MEFKHLLLIIFAAPYFMLLFAFVFSSYLFYHGFTNIWTKYLIENTPTSTIRSLAMGRVEVKGKAYRLTDNKQLAPFSKRKVAYCRWTIERSDAIIVDTRVKNQWHIIEQGVIGEYFGVDDETGGVLVHSKDAEIDVPAIYDTTVLTKDTEEFLKMNYPKLNPQSRHLRYKEYVLREGKEVYIIGNAGDNPFIEDGVDSEYKDIMISKKPGHLYYISDKPEEEIARLFQKKGLKYLFIGTSLMLAATVMFFNLLQKF